MWRSCHAASMPTAASAVASVATQTDPNLRLGRDFEVERTPPLSHLGHSSYSGVCQTKCRPLPLETDHRRWKPDLHCHWNETGETGTTIYEEVTLHRSSKEEKFGLTLWYQSGSDASCQSENGDSKTKVYIGEIDPGGNAAKDDRARIGDRLVKINGETVKSREQVLRLMRSDLPFICLLLSRTYLTGQRDDGFTEDADALESLSFEFDQEQYTSSQLECIDEEDGATDDTGTTENDSQRQDSGFSKTDESTRNEESSEQEAIDDCVISPLADVDCSFHDRHQKSSDSFGSIDWHESDPDAANQDELPSFFQCQQFYEMLKERCNADLATPRTTSKPGGKPASTRDDYAVLERPTRQFDDVAILGRQVAALHLEEGRAAQGRSIRGVAAATRKVPRMGTKIEFGRQANLSCPKEKVDFMEQYYLKQLPEDFDSGDRETHFVSHRSADRFTGECHALDRPRNFVRFSPVGPEQQQSQKSTFAGPLPDSEALPICKPSGLGSNSDTSVNKTQSQMCQTDDDDEGEYEHLVPLDYRFLNMAVQCSCQLCTLPPAHRQMLLENSVQMGPHTTGPICTKASGKSPGRNSTCSDVTSRHLPTKGEDVANSSHNNASMEMEWVVKRRSDGSRYITRRPAKSRTPKERVHRMEKDRSWQSTTDDDASSVDKMERYWAKEDRRRHMEKNRNRRREREAAARQRTADGDDQCTGAEEQPPNIMQLSEKKMVRCKGKKVLDDFTTLQELLAHGSRDPRQARSVNHLLSVTTV